MYELSDNILPRHFQPLWLYYVYNLLAAMVSTWFAQTIIRDRISSNLNDYNVGLMAMCMCNVFIYYSSHATFSGILYLLCMSFKNPH